MIQPFLEKCLQMINHTAESLIHAPTSSRGWNVHQNSELEEIKACQPFASNYNSGQHEMIFEF